MIDPVSASALVIAILSGLTSIINACHLNKCKSACCESDCSKSTPPHSPAHRLSTIDKKNNELFHNLEELIKNGSQQNKQTDNSSNV
jgi:hypothetical protein